MTRFVALPRMTAKMLTGSWGRKLGGLASRLVDGGHVKGTGGPDK